jgi:uncharacterized protein (DUF1015 family)
MAAHSPTRHAFGLYAEASYHLLVLKDSDLLVHCVPESHPPTWEPLDASVAHQIVLAQLVGLPEGASDQQPYLRYHRDPRPAIDNVDRGEGDLLLLLNPTRIDQVKAFAALGIKMPTKSTDFYPKMVAGLTMLPVGPKEEIRSTRSR